MTNAEKYLKEPHDIGRFVQKLVKEISYFDGLRYYSNDMETAIFVTTKTVETVKLADLVK